MLKLLKRIGKVIFVIYATLFVVLLSMILVTNLLLASLQ